jgi:predicted MFS family arabinose efflux permease
MNGWAMMGFGWIIWFLLLVLVAVVVVVVVSRALAPQASSSPRESELAEEIRRLRREIDELKEKRA